MKGLKPRASFPFMGKVCGLLVRRLMWPSGVEWADSTQSSCSSFSARPSWTPITSQLDRVRASQPVFPVGLVSRTMSITLLLPYYLHCFCFCFFSDSTGAWTQGLTLARQVSTTWARCQPFLFLVDIQIESHIFAFTGLYHNPLIHTFHILGMTDMPHHAQLFC
jgi:hypothetical protein